MRGGDGMGWIKVDEERKVRGCEREVEVREVR